MNRNQVLLLLALGGIIAWLLYKGPAVVGAQLSAAASAAVAFVMRTLGKAEAARRAQLIPSAQAALDGLREELERDHGIKTYIGSTLRTPAEQSVLVAGKASDTQNSWHLLGRAVDMYVDNPKTGEWDRDGVLTSRYLQMHRTAVAWGWRGIAFNLATGEKKFLKSGKWDGGHLEFPEGMTYAQAAAEGRATG